LVLPLGSKTFGFADLVGELSPERRAGRKEGKRERTNQKLLYTSVSVCACLSAICAKTSILAHQLAYLAAMNANNSLTDANPKLRYQLKSIDPVAAPAGTEGTWYRYVIVQGISEITGMRPGDYAQVDAAVREMVERLNERSAGKNTKKISPAPNKAENSEK